MSQLQRITIAPHHCGGRPCTRGLRIRVSDILDLLAAGETREEILTKRISVPPANTPLNGLTTK